MCLVFDTNERGSEKANKEKTKQDLQLLNEVWKIVTKFTDPVVRICYKFINIQFSFIQSKFSLFPELHELC